MTNTNLKELRKRFEELCEKEGWKCVRGIPCPVCDTWTFIQEAVLEAEGSVIANNILMTHEDYKKVIDLAQEDERKRIMEIIENMPEFADGTMGDVISKDDILQRIKEMK